MANLTNPTEVKGSTKRVDSHEIHDSKSPRGFASFNSLLAGLAIISGCASSVTNSNGIGIPDASSDVVSIADAVSTCPPSVQNLSCGDLTTPALLHQGEGITVTFMPSRQIYTITLQDTDFSSLDGQNNARLSISHTAACTPLPGEVFNTPMGIDWTVTFNAPAGINTGDSISLSARNITLGTTPQSKTAIVTIGNTNSCDAGISADAEVRVAADVASDTDNDSAAPLADD